MSALVDLNRDEVITEVRDAFLKYEAALLANDVQALNDFFLDAAFTVRYGLAEHSYGIGAIRAYRKHAVPVDPRRTLNNTIITTIGRDAASVCTEFSLPGKEMVGRQTQTWVRCPDGWKIIAAHVSAIPL
ncbi:MAG: oxalurate catabolism protein HpxZ [Steroidobacter sp.]